MRLAPALQHPPPPKRPRQRHDQRAAHPAPPRSWASRLCLTCGLPIAADVRVSRMMPKHLPVPARDQNDERLAVAPAPKPRPRNIRAGARKSAPARRLPRLLAIGFVGICAFLAAFLLDGRAVLQALSALLTGEVGPLARVAAWACLLAVGVIVFMAVRQAVAGNRPSGRRSKKKLGVIPGNWGLAALGAVAVATTGIAAWTVLTWVANILAGGLVLATLAVGVMSIGSIFWAIRQPTYPEPGKKIGSQRVARPPGPRRRPRPKADDTQLRLLPPDRTESPFPHPAAEAALPTQTAQPPIPTPAAKRRRPEAKPPKPSLPGS